MGFLDRFFGGQSSVPDYSATHVLRSVYRTYTGEWPDNNDRYKCWKPASVLPAPKWAVKDAMKLGYAEWPDPIDWPIFRAFFMEFVDLARHLPMEKYEAIERFRKQRIMISGEQAKRDPLRVLVPLSTLAVVQTRDDSNQDIIRVRDVAESELGTVKRIVLEATVEYATLIEEWRFYILSIGRDQFQPANTK